MEKALIPLIAGIIIFFGIVRKARKESKQRDIINKNNVQASADTTTASALNENLKTGDALNFNSYDIPEYKGYHFEIGRGYIRNKGQKFKHDVNPATGLPMIGNVDAMGNPWGCGDDDLLSDRDR